MIEEMWKGFIIGGGVGAIFWATYFLYAFGSLRERVETLELVIKRRKK